jgi:hypothetical protein
VTTDVANAARRLLAPTPGPADARAFAAHATGAFELLAQHLSRLIGELGMRTLFSRSVALSGTAFPQLQTAIPAGTENPYEALQSTLEQESPEAALDAATHVFQTFVQLLERFIGAGLVASLLHEVWPTIFPAVAIKETK